MPPITTKPTQSARITAETTIAYEYSAPNMLTVCALLGSKNPCTADAIP